MFIKQLLIYTQNETIRDIKFHMGLNLIVDETENGPTNTGNNVGKTTVLRLIDYCLGGKAKDIYTSKENGVSKTVKRFLEDNEVYVKLTLVESLTQDEGRKVVIVRNFLKNSRRVCKINDVDVPDTDFNTVIQKQMWGKVSTNPTFRQIISHSIRIDEQRLDHTMMTLKMGNNAQNEALHLYMFGANIKDEGRKEELEKNIREDKTYMSRLESEKTLSEAKAELGLLDEQIETLKRKGNDLILNPNYDNDLQQLSGINSQMKMMNDTVDKLELRESIIQRTVSEAKEEIDLVSIQQVKEIYEQANAFQEGIQHTFEDLFAFHKTMQEERTKFIEAELPELDKKIDFYLQQLSNLKQQREDLLKKLEHEVSKEALDKLYAEQGDCLIKKGQLEQLISQLNDVSERLTDNKDALSLINDSLFSEEYKKVIDAQLKKFNILFGNISNLLYGERYYVNYEVKGGSDVRQHYQFKPCAPDNNSTGKKQGEMASFDLAYVTFADTEKIPCLHFILNDKKELMDGNQMVDIARQTERQNNVQFIMSSLRGKLPTALREEKNVVVNLSQDSRLFKIESHAK